jgi:hypothetical protein
VAPIDAEPLKASPDLSKDHTVIVQQDRQVDRLAICPFTLEKIDLFRYIC